MFTNYSVQESKFFILQNTWYSTLKSILLTSSCHTSFFSSFFFPLHPIIITPTYSVLRLLCLSALTLLAPRCTRLRAYRWRLLVPSCRYLLYNMLMRGLRTYIVYYICAYYYVYICICICTHAMTRFAYKDK